MTSGPVVHSMVKLGQNTNFVGRRTTPRGVFDKMGSGLSPTTLKPPTSKGFSVVKMADIFQPFAEEAIGSDGLMDLDKVISPGSFFNFADQLQLEDMFSFAAATEDHALSSLVPDIVPDTDDNDGLDDVLASVPSSLEEDLMFAVQVVPSKTSSPLIKSTLAKVMTSRRKLKKPISDVQKKKAEAQKMKQRAKKVAVDETKKDAKYWARREKNNAAARRNRQMKKFEKELKESRLPSLDQRQCELIDEAELLKNDLKTLRAVLQRRLAEEGLSHLF